MVPSQSILLSRLAEHRCIRTRRRQNLYTWNSLDHESLFTAIVQEELRHQHFKEACSLTSALFGGATSEPDAVAFNVGSFALTTSDPDPRGLAHQCEICNAAFQRRDHLKRHRMVHSTLKKFGCPACAKAFARSDTLKTHVCSSL